MGSSVFNSDVLMLSVGLFVVVIILLLPWLRNKEKYPLNAVNRVQAPGQFIELKHGSVHYQLVGVPEGHVVVLVHGFSAPSYMWDNNVEALVARGYRVLTFDLYGRGYSSRPSVKYDKALFVEQIRELTSELIGSASFHIVGLSMGGAITSHYIATYPSTVFSVAYIAPFNQPIDIGPLTVPFLGKWLGYSFFVPNLPKNQLNDLTDPSRFPNWQRTFRIQMQYKGFRRAILSTGRYLITQDPTPDFEAVGKTPIAKLLIWGSGDKVIGIEDAPRVQKLLGHNTTFIKMDGAGHAMQYERASEVNRVLLNHLGNVN